MWIVGNSMMESKGQALCWKAGHRLIISWVEEAKLVQTWAVRNGSSRLLPGAAVSRNRGRAV